MRYGRFRGKISGRFELIRLAVRGYRLAVEWEPVAVATVSARRLAAGSPYLCVHGDDRMIRYPGADDLTGEPGDA
ncbi:hypothetical protein DEO72_LG4g463 [Vigna unguiculata]|uniref:Uncharacterized protein n=1 Tax=Vigna unguiculata TaxID=3917 RepID=A0A4D6LLQ1_VIGUN|nr:hypothetical protein DEO72_LG4g463 [Vigna unguiculata]